MKKILLDICYREYTKQDSGHLYDLPKEDPLIKKMTDTLKGSKYPTDGPLLTQGEIIKHTKYYVVFAGLKMDISYTAKILSKLADLELFDALCWIRTNYDRL